MRRGLVPHMAYRSRPTAQLKAGKYKYYTTADEEVLVVIDS